MMSAATSGDGIQQSTSSGQSQDETSIHKVISEEQLNSSGQEHNDVEPDKSADVLNLFETQLEQTVMLVEQMTGTERVDAIYKLHATIQQKSLFQCDMKFPEPTSSTSDGQTSIFEDHATGTALPSTSSMEAQPGAQVKPGRGRPRLSAPSQDTPAPSDPLLTDGCQTKPGRGRPRLSTPSQDTPAQSDPLLTDGCQTKRGRGRPRLSAPPPDPPAQSDPLLTDSWQPKRARGRPRLSAPPPDPPAQSLLTDDSQTKPGRGRPRKSISMQPASTTNREISLSAGGTSAQIIDHMEKETGDERSTLKRGRGRPRKSAQTASSDIDGSSSMVKTEGRIGSKTGSSSGLDELKLSSVSRYSGRVRKPSAKLVLSHESAANAVDGGSDDKLAKRVHNAQSDDTCNNKTDCIQLVSEKFGICSTEHAESDVVADVVHSTLLNNRPEEHVQIFLLEQTSPRNFVSSNAWPMHTSTAEGVLTDCGMSSITADRNHGVVQLFDCKPTSQQTSPDGAYSSGGLTKTMQSKLTPTGKEHKDITSCTLEDGKVTLVTTGSAQADIAKDSSDCVHQDSIDCVHQDSTDCVHRDSNDSVHQDSSDPVHQDSTDFVHQDSTDSVSPAVNVEENCHTEETHTGCTNDDKTSSVANPLPLKPDNLCMTFTYEGRTIVAERGINSLIIQEGAKVFKCTLCGRSASTRNNLLTHVRAHTGERPFACDLCGHKFVTSSNMKRHVRETHKKTRPKSCDICQQGFFTQNAVNKHKVKVHGPSQSPGVIECSVCSKIFKSKSALRAHKVAHTGVKQNCEICGKQFNFKTNLLRHLKIHSDTRPHVCSMCDKRFIEARSLRLHIQTKHEGKKYNPEKEPSHECEVCNRLFYNQSTLTNHMMSHTGVKPHPCRYCGKAFALKTNLKRHINVHFDHRPYICDICNKSFRSKVTLKYHSTIHSGDRPFICTQCTKGFPTAAALREHMPTHHKFRAFSCPDCSRTFLRKSHFHFHRATHTKVSNIICDLCGAKFYRKSDWRRHSLKHTGEKPFPCLICPRKFTRRHYLNDHLKSHCINCPQCAKNVASPVALMTHIATAHAQPPHQHERASIRLVERPSVTPYTLDLAKMLESSGLAIHPDVQIGIKDICSSSSKIVLVPDVPVDGMPNALVVQTETCSSADPDLGSEVIQDPAASHTARVLDESGPAKDPLHQVMRVIFDSEDEYVRTTSQATVIVDSVDSVVDNSGQQIIDTSVDDTVRNELMMMEETGGAVTLLARVDQDGVLQTWAHNQTDSIVFQNNDLNQTTGASISSELIADSKIEAESDTTGSAEQTAQDRFKNIYSRLPSHIVCTQAGTQRSTAEVLGANLLDATGLEVSAPVIVEQSDPAGTEILSSNPGIHEPRDTDHSLVTTIDQYSHVLAEEAGPSTESSQQIVQFIESASELVEVGDDSVIETGNGEGQFQDLILPDGSHVRVLYNSSPTADDAGGTQAEIDVQDSQYLLILNQ